MVRCICPKCGNRGSIQIGGPRDKENRYWYVYHSNNSDVNAHYIGKSPVEVEVIEDKSKPVQTRKVTFDDSTNLKSFKN